MTLPVREILRIGEARLTNSGCSNPKIDSELLYCHLMNIERNRLFMQWGNTLADNLCDCYFELLDERAEGKPLQYIVGHQEFMGIRFEVNEDVLIPRQETELLVEKALEVMETLPKRAKSILDLCTGSGAIAVSIASANKSFDITAADISEKALKVARKNATSASVNVRFTQGDLFSPFKKKFGRTEKFDLIVSNPPYIESEVIPTLQIEVKEYEPILALDGGYDGLDFYRRIIAEAVSHLTKGGALLFEIGYNQGEAIKKIAEEVGCYGEVELFKDLAGLDRIALMYKK